MSAVNDVGVCGMAVMGRNLALNFASKGYQVGVWNRTHSRTIEAIEEGKKQHIILNEYEDLQDLVKSVKKPRKIIMLIQAGTAVEHLIDNLVHLLEKDDILVDGGNELYTNTELRKKRVENSYKIKYMGMGVSGGEEGARFGPSLMPGGDYEAYQQLEPLLVRIAAKIDVHEKNMDKKNNACVTYIGPGGSGNFVKTIHNGIEYGDMQLIAESYYLLKEVCELDNEQIGSIFEDWNAGELKSYLIEITADIFKKKDDQGTNNYLLDMIKPLAGSKGTGKWTVLAAVDLGVPIPTIAAGLDARIISNEENLRKKFISTYKKNYAKIKPEHQKKLIECIREALYISKLCSYAQGFMLLQKASNVNEWNLNLSEVSRIWKGGCIIRANVLDRFVQLFKKNPEIENILLDHEISKEMTERLENFRLLMSYLFEKTSLPLAIPCMSASYFYLQSLFCEKLPQNLTQAQRDFFGAHTFQRIDMDGTFHAEWSKL